MLYLSIYGFLVLYCIVFDVNGPPDTVERDNMNVPVDRLQPIQPEQKEKHEQARSPVGRTSMKECIFVVFSAWSRKLDGISEI